MARVLVVLVLYRRAFDQVPSHDRLLDWLERPAGEGWAVPRLLVYDNSPEAQLLRPPRAADRIDRVHDAGNGGTRAAYLKALDLAEAHRCGWILFLDHDTDLPADFLQRAEAAVRRAGEGGGARTCAVVPHVADRGRTISPAVLTPAGRVHPARDADRRCAPGEHLTAIASASIVRADALGAVRPIPEALRLDYLDHWIFRELQRRGGRVVVSDAEVDHALSVTQMHAMPATRYESILRAEAHFLLGSEGGPSRGRHAAWLVLRGLRMLVRERRPDLARLCLNAAARAAMTR